MKKLYPPEINGTIPAFCGDIISVPYIKNKTVSDSEVVGFALKIKTIQSNTYIGSAEVRLEKGEALPQPVQFDISALRRYLNIGQYYKIQICYIYGEYQGNALNASSVTYGYYSTLGIVKYTTQPVLAIVDLALDKVNNSRQTYMGLYSQQGQDTTEKVYQYNFTIYPKGSNFPLYTSETKFHDSSEDDVGYESIDAEKIEFPLEDNVTYEIQYSVITSNQLTASSPRYPIINIDTIAPDYELYPKARLVYDYGYIEVTLQGIDFAASGRYQLMRSSEQTNFTVWEELTRFALYKESISTFLYKDFTIEQGVKYKYAIRQYNLQGIVSRRAESEEITADFEDMFLYDAVGRQLSIRYNPRVSTFKTTRLEQKIDTIGGQFPTIVRNGRVAYKEFPIQGLISYFMDDMLLFDKDAEEREMSWNLDGENIYAERDFKLEVLQWLNNGEPKLFKSPTEGNYIVRLTGVTLTPVDTVGRMLHSFQCTAYEIAEYKCASLVDNGFIQIIEPSAWVRRTASLILTDDTPTNSNLLLDNHVVEVHFKKVTPGAKFSINDNQEIMIGTTGNYDITDISFTSLKYLETLVEVPLYGTIEQVTIQECLSRFDLIADVEMQEEQLVQFIGENDIYAALNDIRSNVQTYNFIRAAMRDIKPAYEGVSGAYFEDADFVTPLTMNPYTIYGIYRQTNTDKTRYDYYVDGNTGQTYSLLSYIMKYNKLTMDLSLLQDKVYYTFNVPGKDVSTLNTSVGVITEVQFQKQVKTYTVESTYTNVAQNKTQLLAAESRIRQIIESYPDEDEDFDDFIKKRDADLIKAQKARDIVYKLYISSLQAALTEECNKYDI